MIFSMPSYRRLSEADLERLRKTDDQNTSTRVSRALFNILLLAGLWGVILYAYWMVSDLRETKRLSEAIIGKWQYGETALIEFTPDQQVRLGQDGEVIETAGYLIVGDVLKVSDFKVQPDDRGVECDDNSYRISIQGQLLTATPLTVCIPRGRDRPAWARSRLRRAFPQFHGSPVQFRREYNR